VQVTSLVCSARDVIGKGDRGRCVFTKEGTGGSRGWQREGATRGTLALKVSSLRVV
jgi:hypothetical protein